MKKIVYVDHEKSYSNKLSFYLKSSGYDVILADTPEQAHALCNHQDSPSLIISDQKYFDLYRPLTPEKVKFILLTDNAELENSLNAAEKITDEVIFRPKDVETIKLVVDDILTVREPGDEQLDKYFSINVDDILSHSRQQFSLFLKINNKFVCFAKTGQDFSAQKIKLLSDKGIKSVFINSRDYAIYTDLQFTQKSQDKNRPLHVALRQKASLFFQNRLSTSSIFNAINKENAQRALGSLENYTQIAMQNPIVGKAISQLIDNTPILAEKNSLMATVSSCVADLWKWNSPKIQSRIIIGALVCDIGLKDYPQLLGKKKIELTKEESKIYEEHPLRSYKMLCQVEDLPEEILQISIQHHENAGGNGFPQKLIKNQIHSFSKLIHTVNEFIETIFGPKGMLLSPLEALNQMLMMQRKIVSEQVLKTLYKVFSLTVPKELENVLLPDQSGMLT